MRKEHEDREAVVQHPEAALEKIKLELVDVTHVHLKHNKSRKKEGAEENELIARRYC